MSQSTKKPLVVELVVNSWINGTKFTVVGQTIGVVGSGRASAIVSRKEGVVPEGFHLSLLSYVLLTGRPDMSLVSKDAENPFLDAGGVFEALRSLDLGKRGRLVTRYSSEFTETGPRTTFDISGEVEVPPLVAIEPTIETWIPGIGGRIDGHFTMVWKGIDGSYIKGEAETQYYPRTAKLLSQPQFRDIRIEIGCTNDNLSQSERIVLFPPSYLNQLLLSC